MKVLVVHNRYKTTAPSGENIYVEKEARALVKLGYDVKICYIDNDDFKYGILNNIIVFFEILIPFISFIKILYVERTFRPDIIHFHNTFPRIGWLSLRLFAHKAFLTVHNYRLFCANGVAQRHGGICTLCSNRKYFWSSLKYKCYRNSFVSSLGVKLFIFLMNTLGKLDRLNAIFCFSEFQRDLILNFNPQLAKVMRLKNNIHEFNGNIALQKIGSNPIAIYVGRFASEKGIKDLVRCLLNFPNIFKEVHFIGGSIDDLTAIDCEEISKLPNVFVHGVVSQEVVKRYLDCADLLLVPSSCLEGQPTVIFEALERGCLPVVSTVPTLKELSRSLGLMCYIDFSDHHNFYDNYRRMVDAYHSNFNIILKNLHDNHKSFMLKSDLYCEMRRPD